MANVTISLKNSVCEGLSSRKLTLTPTAPPIVAGETLAVGDTIRATTNSTGVVAVNNLVSGTHRLVFSTNTHNQTVYLNVPSGTGSYEAGTLVVNPVSLYTGTLGTLTINLVDLVSNPFSVKKVVLTPAYQSLVRGGDIILSESVCQISNTSGTVSYPSIMPTTYRVDCYGTNAITPFYVTVPTGSGITNAKDCLVVPVANTQSTVIPNTNTNGYGYTVEAANERFALKGEAGSSSGVTSIKVGIASLTGDVRLSGAGNVSVTRSNQTVTISGLQQNQPLTNVVFATGDQTISGIKTFADGISSPRIVASNYIELYSTSVLNGALATGAGNVRTLDWSQKQLTGTWDAGGLTISGVPVSTGDAVGNQTPWTGNQDASGYTLTRLALLSGTTSSAIMRAGTYGWDFSGTIGARGIAAPSFGAFTVNLLDSQLARYDGGSVTLDWYNRVLSGNWTAQNVAVPNGGTLTISGVPVSTGQTQTLTNVVYTTGNQSIGGVKHFTGELQASTITVGINVFNNEGLYISDQANIDTNGYINAVAVYGNSIVEGAVINAAQSLTLSGVSITTGLPYYPRYSNPSGYVSAGQTGSFATTGWVTGYVANQTPANVVYTTGDQTISGVKTFNGDIRVINPEFILGVYADAMGVDADRYVDWAGGRIVYGGGGPTVIDFNNGYLSLDDSNPTLNWKTRVLSGNWTAQNLSVPSGGTLTISGVPVSTGCFAPYGSNGQLQFNSGGASFGASSLMAFDGSNLTVGANSSTVNDGNPRMTIYNRWTNNNANKYALLAQGRYSPSGSSNDYTFKAASSYLMYADGTTGISCPNQYIVGLLCSAGFNGVGATGMTLGNAYGAIFGVVNYQAGYLTNGYALSVSSPNVSDNANFGPITNAYGLYVGSQKVNAKVTNGYGVVQVGTGDINKFYGKTTFGGSDTPTAYVYLNGGTASANTAPLKFKSGTLMSSPEAGAMEYNGSFYITDASNNRQPIATGSGITSGVSFVQSGAGGLVNRTLNIVNGLVIGVS